MEHKRYENLIEDDDDWEEKHIQRLEDYQSFTGKTSSFFTIQEREDIENNVDFHRFIHPELFKEKVDTTDIDFFNVDFDDDLVSNALRRDRIKMMEKIERQNFGQELMNENLTTDSDLLNVKFKITNPTKKQKTLENNKKLFATGWTKLFTTTDDHYFTFQFYENTSYNTSIFNHKRLGSWNGGAGWHHPYYKNKHTEIHDMKVNENCKCDIFVSLLHDRNNNPVDFGYAILYVVDDKAIIEISYKDMYFSSE